MTVGLETEYIYQTSGVRTSIHRDINITFNNNLDTVYTRLEQRKSVITCDNERPVAYRRYGVVIRDRARRPIMTNSVRRPSGDTVTNVIGPRFHAYAVSRFPKRKRKKKKNWKRPSPEPVGTPWVDTCRGCARATFPTDPLPLTSPFAGAHTRVTCHKQYDVLL